MVKNTEESTAQFGPDDEEKNTFLPTNSPVIIFLPISLLKNQQIEIKVGDFMRLCDCSEFRRKKVYQVFFCKKEVLLKTVLS